MTKDYETILHANEKFSLVEVKSETEESDFFIEGYISTVDSDKYHDVVTDSAQDDLVNQISSVPITMDLDHESFVDDKGVMHDRPLNKIPIAKVIEAKREVKGTFVKAKLNNWHPNFKSILKSIKDGFLHSFSIAYVPVQTVKKTINGAGHRLLDKVNLLNVGITGIPVNPNATFAIVTKSFNQKMDEQKNQEFEKQISELKSQTEEFEKVIADLKSELENKDAEIAQLKSEAEQVEEEQVEESEADAEVKSLKEVVEKLTKEFNELKSELAKPVHKGVVEAKSENVKEEQNKLSILEMI